MSVGNSKCMGIRVNAANAPQAGPALSSVAITVGAITPATVSVAYEGLPGNQAGAYNNFVAIWQSTIIPWGDPPLAQKAISGGGQSGSVTLTGLSVQSKPYIIGYGVGKDTSTICVSAVVYVGGQAGPTTSVTIGLSSIASDSLVVHYTTLSGYLPKKSGNWIGLWQGQASPYYSGQPMQTAIPDEDVSEGYIAMDNLTLAFGTTYTLVYFTGPTVTEAAAILTFTTSS